MPNDMTAMIYGNQGKAPATPVGESGEDAGEPLYADRAHVLASLAGGVHVEPAHAAQFPDLVQVADPTKLPEPWMLSAIRRSSAAGGARYVLVGGDEPGASVFHVHPLASGSGFLVARVSYYRQFSGRGQFHHDPTTVSTEEMKAAVEVYERVERYLSAPNESADLVMGAQADKPARARRRTR